MINLILILIPILLADVINPVLLAAVVFALGSYRPVLNALAVLSGWLVLYFIAGIILALGLDAMIAFLESPRPIDFYVETIVAFFLIWLALRCCKKKDPRKKEKDFGEASSLGFFSAFAIGATINLIGLPFAVPYFAAIDQILKADMDWTGAVSVLFIYNLLYILPFTILIIIQYIYKEESRSLFSKINEKMEKIGAILLPAILLLLAAALLTDAVYYFITSKPLY